LSHKRYIRNQLTHNIFTLHKILPTILKTDFKNIHEQQKLNNIMKIRLHSVLLILALPLISIAQEKLVIPKGNAIAFDKQTRQKDGNPGKNYWQNTSDYYIKVSVDVKNKILSGHEKIVYYNNSPDSLKMIVVRLYQDISKKGLTVILLLMLTLSISMME